MRESGDAAKSKIFARRTLLTKQNRKFLVKTLNKGVKQALGHLE